MVEDGEQSDKIEEKRRPTAFFLQKRLFTVNIWTTYWWLSTKRHFVVIRHISTLNLFFILFFFSLSVKRIEYGARGEYARFLFVFKPYQSKLLIFPCRFDRFIALFSSSVWLIENWTMWWARRHVEHKYVNYIRYFVGQKIKQNVHQC